MRAMILAAGYGKRLKPLTDQTPKPLLEIAGKPLILYRLESLIATGVKQFVINLGHLGYQIKNYLGNGQDLGICIQYSDEGDTLLETAGGIIKALPLLGEHPFIVTNADIYTDFDYATLPKRLDAAAHLILVDNPQHNPEGDFALEKDRIRNKGTTKLTYSGIGLFQPRLFKGHAQGRHALATLLRQSAQANDVTGEYFNGLWRDVGTPEQYQAICRDK